MATGLKAALERDGIEPHPRHGSEEGFFVAGYDPPFRLAGRHTEVWMAAAASEDDDDDNEKEEEKEEKAGDGKAYTS